MSLRVKEELPSMSGDGSDCCDNGLVCLVSDMFSDVHVDLGEKDLTKPRAGWRRLLLGSLTLTNERRR